MIIPDQCFPDMVRGNPQSNNWKYLRRGLPHGWLVDRRAPTIGFLNRDEAHILYNQAMRFRGKKVLEIGCWMGWSACHLAMAGVDLDIIDPALGDKTIQNSVRSSLQLSRFAGHVHFVVGSSPAAVHELARARPSGWSFIFVDGDHEGDAPLNDVIACEPYATPDSAMMFHDLASPYVARAVSYLKSKGWKIRVYHTAQMMALAWRGDVCPVAHYPDPRVEWSIPEHVMPLLF